MKSIYKIFKSVISTLFINREQNSILFYFFSALSLFFALLFAYERIYGDAGFTLFTLINENRFVIISSRPITFVIEILPLIFLKLGLPIDKIILSFSINEWFWNFLCATILFYYYKKPSYAIAIYLLYIFSIRWNWFNPVSELILAAPLIFIFGAELQQLNKSKFSLWRLLFLIIVLLFCHPLYSVILPWLLVLYYLANPKSFKEIKFRYINIFIISIILLHYFFLSGYDMDAVTSEHGSGLFKSLSLKLVLNYFYVFPGLIALIIFVINSLLRKSRKTETIIFIVTITGYFLMVIHTYGYYYPETYEPYERYLFPIALVIVFFWFVILNKSWNLLLLIIAFYNISLFISYGNTVKLRYQQFNYILSNAQQWDESKIYIRTENYYPGINDYHTRIGHDWTMPNESILLSSLMKCGTTKQVWVQGTISDETFKSINENSILASNYWTINYNETNNIYFKFKKGMPICANTDSIQSNKPDSFFANISVEPLSPYILKKNSIILIPVKIKNRNSEVIYSGLKKEKKYISYHWKKGNSVIEREGLRSPFAMDVKRTSLQLIIIKTPELAGEYIFVPDIICDGIRRGNKNKDEYVYKIK